MQSGLFNTDALQREVPEGFAKVAEGSTVVLFPPALVKKMQANKQNEEESKKNTLDGQRFYENTIEMDEMAQAVFYNPAQVVNRDLSICAIELFSRQRVTEPRRKGGCTDGITILEALSATGLRAIRYFKEISGVKCVIANDMDADAVECIRRNCAFNGVPTEDPTWSANYSAKENGLGAVVPNLDDAIDLMHRLGMNPDVHGQQRMVMLKSTDGVDASHGGEASFQPVLQQELVDVVDLDPYGSASPFLDGAFRCVKEGGMMLVTSTDSAVLCGNHVDTCHAKYNAVPYKGSHCHEMAVRILLSTIERAANKHKKYIVPLISLHIDFYIRCFFRVYTQPAEVKLSPCKLGYQVQCTHCPAFWTRPMTIARPSRPKDRQKRRRENQGENVEAASVEKLATPRSEMNGHPRLESFPAAPSRQENARLVCSSLSSLSSSPSGEEEARNSFFCPVCGSQASVSGPIYCSPTQNHAFLAELLKVIDEKSEKNQLTATARIKGLVQAAIDELEDCPLFYELPDIASYVKVRCPQTPCFVGALGRLGFRCSQVHCAPSGIKTNCPPDILFSVMLAWKEAQKAEEQKNGNLVSTSAPSLVKLRISPLDNADFSYAKEYDFRRDCSGVAKFIPNAPGWGPKRRHTGTAKEA